MTPELEALHSTVIAWIVGPLVGILLGWLVESLPRK